MFVSKQDIIISLAAIGFIALVLLLIRLLMRKQYLTALLGRQCLHVVAIVTCAAVIHRFDNLRLLAFMFLFFALVLWWAVRKGFMQIDTKKSYGIPLFPLAFAVLLLCPGLSRQTIVLSVLLLGISDAAASWAGSRFARKQVLFLYEPKSWVGFLVFFITAFITTILVTGAYHPAVWLFCFLFALVPALTELFSYKGSDNFTVPLVAALWHYLLLQFTLAQLQALALFSGVLLVLSLLAIYKKWLLPGGATAAVWMGLLFFAADGYRAMALPALFLITGSLLSRLNGEKEESNGRSAVQVFANGIVGAICLVLYTLWKQPIFLLAAIMSFAISMADTIGAELGKYWRGKTWDIITLKPVAVGLSGGVSVSGTLAALIAAFVLATVGGWLYALHWSSVLLITAVGFLGMLIDSVLGSRWQALYQLPDGTFSETPMQEAKLIKGWAWCTNHSVNLLSNTLTISLIILIFCVFTLL